MTIRTLVKRVLPHSLVELFRKYQSESRLRMIGIQELTKLKDVNFFGSAYGGYALPTELVRGRTGLSFGAGEDISFEVSVARDLAATVHIYDPTPRAIEYCRRTISEYDAYGEGQLFIHPYGVWSECKTERFYAPSDPVHVSHSILNMQHTTEYFVAECLSPGEILNRHKLKGISFVKMNIEGAEYEVVNAMFNAHIKPDVICITFDELHSPIDENATHRLRKLVKRFYSESYVPVHSLHCKVTFVHSSYMA